MKKNNTFLYPPPEVMTLICNIQAMQNATFAPLDERKLTLDQLLRKDTDELRELQERLIPEYNAAIREQNAKTH